jgi:hypothetical protein
MRPVVRSADRTRRRGSRRPDHQGWQRREVPATSRPMSGGGAGWCLPVLWFISGACIMIMVMLAIALLVPCPPPRPRSPPNAKHDRHSAYLDSVVSGLGGVLDVRGGGDVWHHPRIHDRQPANDSRADRKAATEARRTSVRPRLTWPTLWDRYRRRSEGAARPLGGTQTRPGLQPFTLGGSPCALFSAVAGGIDIAAPGVAHRGPSTPP